MNKTAAPLVMSAGQREALTILARSSTAAHREVRRATVQKSVLKDLPVGGMSLPSGPCIGPVIVPVSSAIEQVHSPWAKKTLYGRFLTRLSGKVRKNSIASARWSGPPRVGSGLPGHVTTVSEAWRESKVSQSWAFQESSSGVSPK